jgi:hypothetical protein
MCVILNEKEKREKGNKEMRVLRRKEEGGKRKEEGGRR